MAELLRSACAKQPAKLHQVKTPHQGAAHAPEGHQLAGCLRGFVSLAGHHGTNGGKRHPGAPSGGRTLSNMFGNAECHASATPCGRTCRRPQLGPSGSISLTLSLLSPREPCSPAAGEAEQGDVLGTIQSAMVSGDARETHLRDEWFVDGGQVFVRPWAFDGWLRALDAALASFGGHPRQCRAWQREELRSAPLLSARASFWDGTPRTFMTRLPS